MGGAPFRIGLGRLPGPGAAVDHLAPVRLLRFPAAVARDPAIDAWFDSRLAPLGAIAREWFLRMRNCGSDVRELLHDVGTADSSRGGFSVNVGSLQDARECSE